MAMTEASVVPADDRTGKVKSWQRGCTKLVSWKRHVRTSNHGVVENKVEPNTYADGDTFHAPAELQNRCTMCPYYVLIIPKFFPMALALLSRSICIFSAFS